MQPGVKEKDGAGPVCHQNSTLDEQLIDFRLGWLKLVPRTTWFPLVHFQIRGNNSHVQRLIRLDLPLFSFFSLSLLTANSSVTPSGPRGRKSNAAFSVQRCAVKIGFLRDRANC